jgi:glycosyltransferase involved in cell wall biosynthesis
MFSESSPKFSIILPNYKTEFFLEECLLSILNQTYKNFEVLLVNDGSVGLSLSEIEKFESNCYFTNSIDFKDVKQTEQCKFIFDKLVGSDNRFKLLDKVNGGQSTARNFAILQAVGEYCVFVDCDDYIDKDYLLQASLKLEKKEKNQIVFANVKLIEDGIVSDYTNLITHISKTNNLANLFVFPSWTPNPINYFWPTSLIKKYGVQFPEGKKGEDTRFVLENILANYNEFKDKEVLKKFVPIKESIYYYRQFQEQMTKQSDFEYKLFVDVSEYVESRVDKLKKIDMRYGILAKLFVTRFRLYNKRNIEKNKLLKIVYSFVGKILTIIATLIAKIV